MRTAPDSPSREPNLGGVGVGPVAERVYRHLVHDGCARTADEVATALHLPPRTAVTVLRGLDRQALVTRTSVRPVRFSASPPELALEPLLAHRREELAEIRLVARELQGAFSRAVMGARVSELVEAVVGRERVRQYYLHLVQGTRTEFDALTKPPYAADEDVSDVLDAEEAAIGRGVHARSIFESEALDTAPVTLALAEHGIALGVQARATSALPMKFALFDRRVGFVPLVADEPGHGALVVRPSPLLDALGALFDSIWATAVPLLPGRNGPVTGTDDLDDRSRQVLLLMSDGLKDESIARALGLSRRTVQKCVTAAMTRLGARTRFQAALRARDRGWLRAD